MNRLSLLRAVNEGAWSILCFAGGAAMWDHGNLALGLLHAAGVLWFGYQAFCLARGDRKWPDRVPSTGMAFDYLCRTAAFGAASAFFVYYGANLTVVSVGVALGLMTAISALLAYTIFRAVTLR